MEKSVEQTPGTHICTKITTDVIDGSPMAAKAPGLVFKHFERIENRRQTSSAVFGSECTPEGIKSYFTCGLTNDYLSPTLRSGSPLREDQEHKK